MLNTVLGAKIVDPSKGQDKKTQILESLPCENCQKPNSVRGRVSKRNNPVLSPCYGAILHSSGGGGGWQQQKMSAKSHKYFIA